VIIRWASQGPVAPATLVPPPALGNHVTSPAVRDPRRATATAITTDRHRNSGTAGLCQPPRTPTRTEPQDPSSHPDLGKRLCASPWRTAGTRAHTRRSSTARCRMLLQPRAPGLSSSFSRL